MPNAACPSWSTARPIIRCHRPNWRGWLERFILEDGLNLVAVCCGTDIPHIQALDQMLRKLAGNKHRPRRCSASRFGSGRCIALQPGRSASGKFTVLDRRALQRQRLQTLRPAARGPRLGRLRRDGARAVGEGSNALDVCMAFVGRDEMYEMSEIIHAPDRVGGFAAGDRLDRDAGDRSGAETLWRQGDHQLDQFRGWSITRMSA